MLALVHQVQRHDFDLARLPPETSVLVEDLAFNALLVTSNHSLERIAAELGVTLEPALTERFRRTESALGELWDDERGQYFSRDVSSQRLIKMPTIATFFPLWTGVVPSDRERRLVALLVDPARYWPRHPVPSVAVDAKEFDDDRYWRGPTWVNTNWIIVESLRAIGHHDLADDLRARTLELVERSGFAEYFSALHGDGYGASEFSWTAALTLDLCAGAFS
jgi:neutral trehalase